MYAKFIFFSILFLVILGCSKPEDRVPTTTAKDGVDDLVGSMVLGEGALSGRNGYTSQGKVRLSVSPDGKTYSLIFENFSSSNGPDLKVYLASDDALTSFINLGDLKSTNGLLRYDFPATQFVAGFDTAVIWCQQFSVSFGVASLLAP